MLKTDTRESQNQGRAEREHFKVWKGKVARYTTVPNKSLNLFNKFETLGDDKEVPKLVTEDVFKIGDYEAKIKALNKKLEKFRSKTGSFFPPQSMWKIPGG